MTTTRQNVPSNFANGGIGLTPEGSSVPMPTPAAFGRQTPPANPDLATILWALLARVGPTVADLAALAAFGSTNTSDREDLMLVPVASDGSVWRWRADSDLPAAPGSVVVTTDNPTLGRFELAVAGSTLKAPMIPVDLKGAVLAAGTPLAAWAGAGPGTVLSNSKAVGVKWTGGTLTTIWTGVDLPLDLDPAYPVTAKFLVSKTGATPTDVASITVAAYAQVPGALEDAGSNLGSISTALTTPEASAPAKTVTELQAAIYLPPTPPATLSLSLTPSGTLVTDNLVLEGCWLEYTRKSGPPRVVFDVRAAVLAAGTPMAAWADNASSNPGVTLNNSKAVGVRWNNNASQTAIYTSAILPGDMDVSKPALIVALVSKSGATVGDASTLDVALYEQLDASLEDAGSNLGGTTSALVGNATAKTVSRLTLGIPANTLTAGPHPITVSVKPTNGTLGTDDLLLEGLWLEYTPLPAEPIVAFDLKAAVLAAGTPMAAWANNASSNPGVTLNNSKAVGVRWNNNASQTYVYTERDLPLDFDPNQDATLYALVSKSGATAADLLSLSVALYEQVPGSLEDAGPSLVGTTGALTAVQAALAAKTLTLLSLSVPAGTLSRSPGRLTVAVKPTNGTLGTDDALVSGLWLTYAPRTA